MYQIVDTFYGPMLLNRDSKDPVTAALLDGFGWDRFLLPYLSKYAGSGTAVDAGAFVGTESIYMSRRYREVFAFEPFTPTYRALCANVLINGCDNVYAYNAALYDHSCFMSPMAESVYEGGVEFVGGVPQMSSRNIAALAWSEASHTDKNSILSMTIDSLHIPDVSMIKIDTQGSDLRVMMGAMNTIERCRPCIVFEYADSMAQPRGDDLEKYYDFLKELPDYYVEKITPLDYVCEPKERIEHEGDWNWESFNRLGRCASADADLPTDGDGGAAAAEPESTGVPVQGDSEGGDS